MAITPLSTTSLYRNVEQTKTATSADTSKDALGSNYEQQQAAKNTAIVEAQLEVSMQAGNQPMELLYRSALDAINEELAPVFGDNAAQQAVDDGVDVSPEATADRIVAGSTKYFEAFLEVNTDLDGEAAVNEYMSIISGAVDKGFEEAHDILDSLAVLEGDIANNIDATYTLVQEGLQQFMQTQLDNFAPPAASE
ncbi:DUF5610 domain-containing protein [Neiella marina]|uniref:DUF5610 domain-containing protein n=1 Tax=Neiella holothuriorum TaxID=2870530 RepID=A0ABS7EJE2_9GAMM|nr:DUF5610 domain-containing protein [Neiella holothuriorum]MBW8192335.1 DUF5610 domain-containing protein [Neiella holothuriorum]